MRHRPSEFEGIYRGNYPKVIRICMGYVRGDEALAQDLAQEVFIKVWEHQHSFRNESSVATWIYRITVNTCLLHFRNRKLLKGAAREESLVDSEDEAQPSKEKQMQQLYGCIEKLPKDSKAIILLELEGLPQKEIAEVMGLSHEAVRVRVHRIKNSLTKCVQNDSV